MNNDNNINYIIASPEPMACAFDPTAFAFDPTAFDPTAFDLNLYENETYGNETYGNEAYSNETYNYDELFALYMSYTVKSLTQIMNYYGLNKQNINNKKKLVKDEMIQLLILFEVEENNRASVLKRRRLWQNMAELSADPFFKPFIMFTV
jgi:hypothetical protein